MGDLPLRPFCFDTESNDAVSWVLEAVAFGGRGETREVEVRA